MGRAKKRKGIKALRSKYPILSKATDALIGEEEQDRKEKKTKRKKETGMDTQPSCPGPFSHLLQSTANLFLLTPAPEPTGRNVNTIIRMLFALE